MNVTSDLTKFGFRELDMAGDLLKAYAKNGCEYLDNGVQVYFNDTRGNVFLSDEDGMVGMIDSEGKLKQWYSCSNCGNESFDKTESTDGLYDFRKNEGYCSRECLEENLK